MRGLIVKGIAGFYYVRSEGRVYQCRARGVFKKNGVTPLTGDLVDMELLADGDGVVRDILPRKNSFVRPPVANVDQFVIVTAAADPDPVISVIDRFLVMAESKNTSIILCINKIDIGRREAVDRIGNIYDGVYPVHYVSGMTGEGIEGLQKSMAGLKNALAGPSGAGKSTILNRLIPGAAAETGDISMKTGRGKHTTRHVEIFEMPGEGQVYDTPGFTSLDIEDIGEEELQYCYPEMRELIGHCRYDDCRHVKEPDCAVLAAVNDGRISRERYLSYALQLAEIQKKKKY